MEIWNAKYEKSSCVERAIGALEQPLSPQLRKEFESILQPVDGASAIGLLGDIGMSTVSLSVSHSFLH